MSAASCASGCIVSPLRFRLHREPHRRLPASVGPGLGLAVPGQAQLQRISNGGKGEQVEPHEELAQVDGSLQRRFGVPLGLLSQRQAKIAVDGRPGVDRIADRNALRKLLNGKIELVALIACPAQREMSPSAGQQAFLSLGDREQCLSGRAH